MRNKTIILVQARLGSKRFPKKILQKIGNKTVIEILYNRIRSIKVADKVIIVTTKNKIDNALVNFLKDDNSSSSIILSNEFVHIDFNNSFPQYISSTFVSINEITAFFSL